MAALSLRSLSKCYERVRDDASYALRDVSLEVADGEFCVLVGPSGCGKSTLLRIVAGLVAPTSGQVLIDGRDVGELGPRERDVAMVFQNYALYPHMSVRENLAFPLRMQKLGRVQVTAKVNEVADALGLGGLLAKRPHALSGGQMQRVALGRAIVRDPELFLFDEPLSNLDAAMRTEMRAEIAALCRRLGVTALYVTHDQAEALTMGSALCVLERGRVQQTGSPRDVYAAPANTFVASFLGSPPMNLLRATVHAGRARLATGIELAVPAELCDEREVVVGVRPGDVVLGSGAPFAITHVEALGSTTHVRLEGAGHVLWATAPGDARYDVGAALPLSLPPERLHWFDRAGLRRV